MRRSIVVLLLSSCASSPPAAPPAGSEDAQRRAFAAFDELQTRLGGRLKEVMAAGGPASAVAVCAGEAQAISAEIAGRQGLAMGRTSHRLRNPANAPRAWVEPWLSANAGRAAADVQPATFDLGDRTGVVRPIAVQPLCLACHGGSIAPEVQQVIDAAYPGDAATGFAEGELRGAFWAEVPR